MDDREHSITARVESLRQEIRRHRRAVDLFGPDDPGYDARLAEVIAATNALLAYERRIPGLRQQRSRPRTTGMACWLDRLRTLRGHPRPSPDPGESTR